MGEAKRVQEDGFHLFITWMHRPITAAMNPELKVWHGHKLVVCLTKDGSVVLGRIYYCWLKEGDLN